MLEEKKKIIPSRFLEYLQISKNASFLDSLYRGASTTLQGTCRSRVCDTKLEIKQWSVSFEEL